MHNVDHCTRIAVRWGLTFLVATAVFGLGPALAQDPPPTTKAKGLTPTVNPTLKPGALPGPSKVPLDASRKLAQTRPKIDTGALRRPAPAVKAGVVGTTGGKGRGANAAGAGGAEDEGEVGGAAAGLKGGSKFAAGGRTPPGVEDKSEEAKVPAWRKVEEDAEAEKPTLSADFIKNCAQLSPGVKVHLDIYDEELEAVVKLIACMTGKNIILAKPLKGKKITIYSPTLVTANEAYKAFLTALEANGFTISKQGRFLRIIEIKDFAKQSDPFLPSGSTPPAEDRMVTQIVNLTHVDSQEINEVISKLATANAQIIVYAPTNSLIMTELSSNLRKLRTLIKELDVPGGQEQLWTYQVLHADATEIATKIQEVFEAGADGGAGARARPAAANRAAPAAKKAAAGAGSASSSSVGESELDVRVSKILADERTNRLLIVTTARSYRRVKSLIAKLDIPIPGDGQVHIHQLDHAKAADLATVLSNLSQEARNRQQQGAAGNRRAQARGAQAAAAPAAGARAGGSSAALFEGEVTVTADEATNALVVTASLKDFVSLKRVIDVLDKPRRQVFIETVIMEVSISSDRNVGLSFHGGVPDLTVAGEKAPLVFGSQTAGSSLSLLSALDPSSLTGLAVAAQSERSLSLGDIGQIPAFGVVIKALAKSNDVNIMSAPHILTTDNEEAEIVVGSNVPFIAGGLAGGLGGLGGLAGGLGGAAGGLGGLGGLGGGLFPTVNVQRQDVALTLKITPRINALNFVTLEVDQIIEEIESIDQRLGPTTSKRQIKSTVVVGDQNTVVIGGLQKTRQVNSRDAVPFLGEIPIIGYLFRNVARQHERRNLLLLLTPHVIEGPNDFKAIFERKMEEQREFQARFQKEGDAIKLGVDYGKKHGAIEAINKTIRVARDEQRVIQELRNQDRGLPLPQDIDGIEVDEAPGGGNDRSRDGSRRDGSRREGAGRDRASDPRAASANPGGAAAAAGVGPSVPVTPVPPPPGSTLETGSEDAP